MWSGIGGKGKALKARDVGDVGDVGDSVGDDAAEDASESIAANVVDLLCADVAGSMGAQDFAENWYAVSGWMDIVVIISVIPRINGSTALQRRSMFCRAYSSF